jgi:hypothetical protein
VQVIQAGIFLDSLQAPGNVGGNLPEADLQYLKDAFVHSLGHQSLYGRKLGHGLSASQEG